MANVIIVTGDGAHYSVSYLTDLLEDLGHSVAVLLDSLVSASNLSTADVILNYALDAGTDEVALAGFYDDYMTAGKEFLWYKDFTGHPPLTDDNYETGSGYVQCLLGVTAATYRNRYAGAVDPVGYGDVFPADKSDNHEVSMVADAHEDIVGQGFLQPNFQGEFEGESFVWGTDTSGGGDVASVPPGEAQVAGTPLVRLKNTFWGDAREIAASLYDVGDSRVGQHSGTFPTRGAHFGGLGGARFSRNAAQMIQALIRWAVGDYAGIDTYSTAAKSHAFRYPSFALDTINGTTYASSSITWEEVTPAGTSIVVEASLDGETFSTIASSGDPIPGLSASDPIAGLRLHIRVEMITADGVSTPQFRNLAVEMLAQQTALTASPDDYFQEGHLLWTSGDNSGQAIEVKSYDDATREMMLFLKMRDPISVGDQFTVLPGCDKTKTTCIAKFGNMVNFQGEPDIPGEDQVVQTAEVHS